MSTIYIPQKRIYSPNDAFFEEGNIALRALWLQKQAESEQELNMIREEAQNLEKKFSISIYCDECRTEFPSTAAFESHYEAIHRNVCSVCHKVFPGSQWLQLHLDEFHDVILQLKKERGEKIYKCYVETCKKVFSTPRMRRLHLVDKHHYPRYFPFELVCTGTLSVSQKKQRVKRNRQRLQGLKNDSQDTEMEELTNTMSKLKLPTSISFGHQPPALPQYRKKAIKTTAVTAAKDVEMKEGPTRPKRKRGPKKKKTAPQAMDQS